MMFKTLSQEEETDYRQWARQNFNPGDKIKEGVWHPVVCDECHKMVEEFKDDEEIQPKNRFDKGE